MRQILTSEQIIESFRKVHGNTYDYSKVVYIKSNEKIEIICPEHGPFFQTPNHHKSGAGCPKCNSTKKLTQEEVIAQFKETHGDKYDYSKVRYIRSKDKVEIICKVHGPFF